MTSNNEEKINKLLEFPYDAFLMVRLEYVQILGDELEAKLLRIIEKYVDMERRRIYQKTINAAATNGQVAEITKDVWVPISYRLFMNDLFGTVTSENTVKKALREMAKKRIIFQRFQPKKKYDAPEYKIHVNPLQVLLSMLPNPGYQKLIPSYIDTLKDLPPQELTPSECQELIPLAALRVSKVDTNITEVTDNNSNEITERESIAHNLDTPTFSPPVVGDALSPFEQIPITFNEALYYLQPHGGPPPDYDSVQIIKLAQKLWVEAQESDNEMQSHIATSLSSSTLATSNGEEDITQAETVKTPVAPKQNTSTPTPAQPTELLSVPSPQGQVEQAAPGPRARGKKQTEPKPETPKSPPVEPPSDMAWGTRKCLLWFDYWRGGILIGKFKLMQASTCAKGLAEQFDEQTVIQARTDMEADPYYAAKGGCDVCDVANNIHKYLKKRQSKVIAFRGKPLPPPQEDLVEWQGQMMTVAEADALGFNGGFGAYL